jgi:hypothetical protein
LKEFLTFLPLIGQASHTSKDPQELSSWHICNGNHKSKLQRHMEIIASRIYNRGKGFTRLPILVQLFPLSVLISPLWPKSLRHALVVHGPSWGKCWWRTGNEPVQILWLLEIISWSSFVCLQFKPNT